jgi:hypothetical protein
MAQVMMVVMVTVLAGFVDVQCLRMAAALAAHVEEQKMALVANKRNGYVLEKSAGLVLEWAMTAVAEMSSNQYS